jgi:hypothetical protein
MDYYGALSKEETQILNNNNTSEFTFQLENS